MPADPTAPLPDEELAAIEARDAADYERLGQGAFWHQSHIDRRTLLAAHRAERAARTLPPHTRLVLAGETILDDWGTRTEDGDLLTVEWGEQQPGGWYEPTFTRHSDDNPLRAERAARARVEGMDVNLLDMAVLVLAGTGEIEYDYKRPPGRESRRIAYRLSVEYAALAPATGEGAET
jgi:hypothetical protein